MLHLEASRLFLAAALVSGLVVPTALAEPTERPRAPAPTPSASAPASTAGTAPPATGTASASGTAPPVSGTAPTTNPPPIDEQRQTALVAQMTLKVKNATDARKNVVAAVRKRGGYPMLVTDTGVELKLPPAALSDFLEWLGKRGLVVDKSMERADLTLDIAKLEGQLKSKRTILAELRSFFDSSDVEATLQIERSMADLVGEIEAVKGALRVLRDRSEWALVSVSFQFRKRERIEYAKSQFEWMNSVKLDRFLQEF